MKCILIKADEPPRDGAEKFVCARGCKTDNGSKQLWVPIGSVIRDPGPCNGWPLLSEASEWAEGLVAIFGTRGAAKLYRQALWRLRGSPIDELPPGVPRPNLVKPPAPAEGPGTELAAIFKEAGASSDQCGWICKQWEEHMNWWGSDGCRKNRHKIIERIEEAAYKTWVTEQIRIGWSISREPWWRASDPVGSIVDHAIDRAEQKALAPAGDGR